MCLQVQRRQSVACVVNSQPKSVCVVDDPEFINEHMEAGAAPGHACEYETSTMLHLFPDRSAAAALPMPFAPWPCARWPVARWPAAQSTRHGLLARSSLLCCDPTCMTSAHGCTTCRVDPAEVDQARPEAFASAEKGAALLEPAVAGCTALLHKMIGRESIECEPVTFRDGQRIHMLTGDVVPSASKL